MAIIGYRSPAKCKSTETHAPVICLMVRLVGACSVSLESTASCAGPVTGTRAQPLHHGLDDVEAIPLRATILWKPAPSRMTKLTATKGVDIVCHANIPFMGRSDSIRSLLVCRQKWD